MKTLNVDIHSPVFLRWSCFTGAAFFVVSAAFMSFPWSLAGVVAAFVLIGLAVESMFRTLPSSGMNTRYEVTVYAGVVVTLVSMAHLDRPYVLFIPTVLGILYKNINAYMKSKRVDVVVSVFMLVPVFKIAFGSMDNKLEYAFVALLFTVTIIISSTMFRSTAEARYLAEHKHVLLHTVVRAVHGFMAHDIRNIANNLGVLACSEYMESKQRMLEKIDWFSHELGALTDFNIFALPCNVDLREIVHSLPVVRDSNMLVITSIQDTAITVNKHMLYAVLKNVVENANEAAQRRGLTRARLEITQAGNMLSIVDNCGGFDTSKIQAGMSSKSVSGHGQFLAAVVDPAMKHLFGIMVDVRKITTTDWSGASVGGTCVTIRYGYPVESLALQGGE